MTGHRVYVSPAVVRPVYRPGDYTYTARGWLAVLPDDQCGLLNDHAVEEHDDGTITVSGAIYTVGGAWSLTRGVWTEAA